MKIVTWNINSIRLRIDLIKQLKSLINPDVIFLQETKVINDLFPEQLLKDIGYGYHYFIGQKSYNGVAAISRIPFNSSFSLKLFNDDARHLAVKIHDVEIHNFYVPAGGDVPDAKLNDKFYHKLEYIKEMQRWFTSNRNEQNNIILLGDLNIAPHENDVWSSKQLKNTVSHTSIERNALINLQQSLNFIDSARIFIPFDQKCYSWWSYRNQNWRKSDRGRRLDHIWTSKNLSHNISKIEFIKDARDWIKPSDHIPYAVSIN
ncbi:MAG: exodeoxyribonuclease III [Rickettsiaceae bacterium]